MRRNGQGSARWRRFMEGRSGVDQFSRFLSLASCVVILLALIIRPAAEGRLSSGFVGLALAMLFWCYWRVFSRKIELRQKENLWYLEKRDKVTGWFRFQQDRFRQRKEYVFFRCPGCRTIARVPRGKGHIRITCRHCGYTFEKKT